MANSFPVEGQNILIEDYDEDYEPTEEEVFEYCKVLELNPMAEKEMLYIAKEGIKAPLPKDWKPIEDQSGNIYYFNFSTGESTWEHPCDEFYRKLLQQEREKKSQASSGNGQLTINSSASTPHGNSKPSTKHETRGYPMGAGPGLRSVANTGPGLRSEGGLLNTHTPGGGGVSRGSGLTSVQPLGKLPNMGGSLGRAKLAPISLGSKPLPSIGGLPSLKAPPTHAFSNMSHSGAASSVSGSLSSTGASRLKDPLATSFKNSDKSVGNVDLGTVRISTTFEDEDDESASSHSDLRGGQFRNSLGVNILGVEDIGLKECEEVDSTEDVSNELRKIMDISSDRGDKSISEDISKKSVDDRPSAPLHFHDDSLRMDGVGMEGTSPVYSPRLSRPGAAKTRTRVTSTLPLQSGILAHGKGELSSPAFTNLKEPVQTKPLGHLKAVQDSQADHEDALRKLKEEHAKEIRLLKERLVKELEETKESLNFEDKAKIVAFREQLARELIAKEKELKANKVLTLSDIQAKVQEEREDEEARLEEGKQDYLRNLKQKLSNEREREENKLREANTKALAEVSKQIESERDQLESDIRSKDSEELAQLKETLLKEIQEEKKSLKSSLEEELETTRRASEEEIGKKKNEMTEEYQLQMDELNQQKEQYKTAVQSALTEIRESNSLDKVRENALRSHQEAILEIQGELESALEVKKKEFEEQHQHQLEELEGQLCFKLNSAKEEWAVKIAEEKDKLSNEFESEKESLTQKHEATLQFMSAEFKSNQETLQQESKEQSQELATLEAEFESKREKIKNLELALDHQHQELLSRKQCLEEEREKFKKEEEALVQLKSASAQEREKILDKQQRELKKSIEIQKEALTELKRSYGSELHKLQEQKSSLLSSLKRLERRNGEVKGQLISFIEQVEQEKEKLVQTKRENKPSQKTSFVTRTFKKTPELHFMRRDKDPMDDMKSASSENESDHSLVTDPEETAGAMDIGELVPQSESEKSSESDTESSSFSKTDTLNDSQRKLKTEPKPHNISKEFSSGHSTSRKHGKYYHKERTRDGIAEPLRLAFEDSNMNLLKEIQTKLKQEATVLKILEDRMRASDTLFDRNERVVNELEGTLTKEFEEMSEQESEDCKPLSQSEDDLNPDITSAKTYLARLKASLEKSSRYTQSKTVNDKAKSTHLSSPLPSQKTSTHQKRTKSRDKENSGAIKESPTELVSSDTSFTAVSDLRKGKRQHRGPQSSSVAKSKSKNVSHSFSPATRGILSGTGGNNRVSFKENPSQKPSHIHNQHDSIEVNTNEQQSLIYDSLNTINSQLGKLLARMPENHPNFTPQGGYLVPPPPVPSMDPVSMNGGTVSVLSQSRWAHPVQRPIDLEVEGKRTSHLGSSMDVDPYTTKPHVSRPAAVRPQLSTEDLMRTQTDWLKEFRQSVPLSSALITGSSLLASTPTPPTHISSFTSSVLTHPKANVLPSKPRLVLDETNNIKLVHI